MLHLVAYRVAPPLDSAGFKFSGNPRDKKSLSAAIANGRATFIVGQAMNVTSSPVLEKVFYLTVLKIQKLFFNL